MTAAAARSVSVSPPCAGDRAAAEVFVSGSLIYSDAFAVVAPRATVNSVSPAGPALAAHGV